MVNENSLVKYNAACKALIEAKSVDEVLQISNKAEALRVYARLAKNHELEIDAAEIRIRSERRLGEMIKEQRETVGLAKPGRKTIGSKKDPISETPPLASAGIDKHLADRARKLAAVPTDKFASLLDEWRERTTGKEGIVEKDILKVKAHVSHNSGENEWYTPKIYIDAARTVMGDIDCDPASSQIANHIVKAKTFFTVEDDGLKQKWGKRIWMNPPYSQPSISQFVILLSNRVKSGEVKEACVLVNNATETEWGQILLKIADSVCFLKGRVRFIDQDGNPGGAPLQGQIVVYIGSNATKFAESFKNMGVILRR
ncbi:MAG: DNA N-6-adenine-methyltransferase [Kiritimatiellia bacterium]|nr:DNA N-6-adenine-methyltransferase [Kiritimatiellia bacterium]